jgi:hypothetical protein
MDDPRVIGLFIADKQPGIDAKSRKAIEHGHRSALRATADVSGIDDHDFGQGFGHAAGICRKSVL